MKKKVLSIFLTAIIVLGVTVPTFYVYADESENVSVSATADETIKIQKVDENNEEPDYDGILELTGGSFDIERNYSQSCKISVKNVSNSAVKYYLAADNKYNDIYLNFVRNGSVDTPIIVDAGETQEVQLDIFAQNATETKYELAIFAHILNEDDDFIDSKTTITLNCPEISTKFSLNELSENPNSLAKSFVLQNLGEDVTDVEVYAEGDAADYTSFSPVISNCPMTKGEKIEFKASPDLTKMKNDGLSKVEGDIIVAVGGKTQRFNVSFDTKGQEIVSMTVGELAALQNKESLDGLKTDAISSKAAVKINYKTSQCTNAGKQESDFILGDFDILGTKSLNTSALDPNDVELYITNRMYGGDGVNRWYGSTDPNYIDIKDTNYTYILNGKKVGTTYNSGVTDVAIVKLPAENLIFGGKNKLICDYDTNPGHYFVTTDTQITITIPGDTPISYIGKPEGLEDIRSLPDFCVYSENIFPSKDIAYLGEPTEISLKVYNRGSEDGTFDIEVSDGTGIIFSEKAHSLNAFSGDTVSFDWTPENETSNITVTLTNTDSSIPERDTQNNTATKAITVSARKTPTILLTADVTSVYKDSCVLYTNIKDYNEVKKVEFFVDDVLVSNKVENASIPEGMRYYVSTSAKYSVGNHTIKAIVTYNDTATTEKTIESAATLTVTKKELGNPSVTISLPEYQTYRTTFYAYAYLENIDDVVSVKFLIDDAVRFIGSQEHELEYSCPLSSLDVGQHTIKAVVSYRNDNGETVEIVSAAESITILSEAESNFTFEISKDLAENISARVYYYYGENGYSYNYVYPNEDHETEDTIVYKLPYSPDMIRKKNQHFIYLISDNAILSAPLSESNVKFTKDSCHKLTFAKNDNIQISEITLRSFGGRYAYSYAYTNNNEFYCTPGKLNIELDYSAFGSWNYDYFEVDLTDGDKIIDLTANHRAVKFAFEGETSESVSQAVLYYNIKTEDDDYWDTLYGDVRKDNSTNVYSLTTTSASAAGILDGDADIKLFVQTNDAVYFADVVSIEDIIVLKKADLKKVTVNVENAEAMTVKQIRVSNGLFDDSFIYGNQVYLPSGLYDLTISIQYSNGKTVQKMLEVTVAEQDQTITLKNDFAKIDFKWSNAFNSNAEVFMNGTSNVNNIISTVQNESFVYAAKDQYNGNIRLVRNDSYFNILSKADCSTSDCTVEIGDQFIGKIKNDFREEAYNGKSHIDLYLKDLTDNFGNVLSSFGAYDSDDYLTGYVIFTNVIDEKDVIKVPVSVSYLSDLDGVEYVELPNVTGEYKVSVELTTENIIKETELILPQIEVVYDKNENVYKCGKLPEISLGEGSTEGTISWNTTELKAGTNEYTWTFTPEDQDVYQTVTGTETITVVDDHFWGMWTSDGNAKFFCEGTKTHTCLICGETEKEVDEGSAGYHAYLCGGERSWVTAAVLTAIGVTITWFVIHLNFWWVIGL